MLYLHGANVFPVLFWCRCAGMDGMFRVSLGVLFRVYQVMKPAQFA